MAVIPKPLAVISISASLIVCEVVIIGVFTPLCITSFKVSSNRFPKLPPGCDSAKSSAVNPRASNSATAIASPIASVAVVLAVGAKPNEQASFSTLMHTCTLASVAMVDCVFPVMEIIFAPRRFNTGIILSTSLVSPELEISITTSFLVIMPKSPWLASPGCTKKAGLPVLAKVAAILWPICPDLPIPIIIIRPLQSYIS